MGIFRKISERIRGFKIEDGVLIKYKGKKKKVVIPKGVTSVGDEAFAFCRSKSIVIPNSVTSIGDEAFYYCDNLTNIVIPDSVTSIGDRVFGKCDTLENITVKQGNPIYHSAGNCLIETKSKTLIVGCKNSVIPADGSVTRIGDDAFYGCDSLTSIVIPDGVTSIGDNAFEDCSSLTSIVIPDGVTRIGNDAFYWCSSLTSIVIPKSVISIGSAVFSHCRSLENITVEQGNPIYHSAGNCLIETKRKTLIAGCKNSVIPADGSVTSIDYCAFSWCDSLTNIVIPDGVTSIGDNAFEDCSSLESISIPDSVTSIWDWAFSRCYSLQTIEYTGTEEQWKAVKKGRGWKPENAKVICTGTFYGNSKSI